MSIQTTTLTSPAEVREFLLAVGTQAPSLHPDIDSDNSWKRWNGWNLTVAVGVDAQDQPFMVDSWHFASGGHVDFGGSLVSGHSRLGLTDETFIKRTGIVFPVEVLPAASVIRHPEHTPVPEPSSGCDCDAIDGDHDRPRCAIYVKEQRQ